MYKPTCSVLLLAALAGCSTVSEVAPNDAVPAGDVAPARVYAMEPVADVVMDLAQVSVPLPTQDLRTPFTSPAPKAFAESTFFVDPGSRAGDLVIPVDRVEGAVVYLLPLSGDADSAEAGKAERDEVLADVQLFAPGSDTPLNERTERDLIDGNAPAVHARPMGTVFLEETAPTGDYVVRFGDVAAEKGFRVEMRVPESPLALAIQPTTDTMLRGGEGDVVARVEIDGRPVPGAEVEAWLASPNGGAQVPLAVEETAPGEWHANLPAALGDTTLTGVYNVYVRASGSADGVDFDRFGWTAAHFGVPTGRITKAGSPSPVRAAGLAGSTVVAWEVPFELEVASLDRYELSGTLVYVDAEGLEHLVARAQTAAGLDAGTHELALSFDAGHIGLAGVEGPFELRDVTLFSQGRYALFSRVQDGMGVEIGPVDLSELATAASTPALDRQNERGAHGM
ncbi:MAG: hypothetical protein EP330_26245 [Deltaproteobacteria bacterium]|nr:MAG: hypothetical protein EP330_26245 [Deltaproteobacteria bacterium]